MQSLWKILNVTFMVTLVGFKERLGSIRKVFVGGRLGLWIEVLPVSSPSSSSCFFPVEDELQMVPGRQ